MIRLSLSCLLAFSLALGVPDRPGARVLAQTPAPIVGTWVLSPLKSTAITGTFKERRLEAREGPDGLTITNVTVDADGRTSQWGFTTRGDGPVAVTGLPAIDTVVVRLEPTRDGHPFGGGSGLYTYKKAGQVVLESILEVAPDGRSLTIKSIRTMADGSKTASLTFYERR